MEATIREANNGDAAAVRRLVFDVLGEYGIKPGPAATDRDLDDIEGAYLQSGGTFRVIEAADGTVVGCGGLLPLSPDELELRKMYLLPEFRGRGLGKRLLVELIEHARQRQVARITLETATVLKEAIALYQAFGFVPSSRANLAGRCDQAWELRLRD